ncbi:hypothetical protein AAFC00_006181 [Neodothiora populina]|uniref:MARVEL domain-containing protein n=1 Tax=Neodothiora populina TaxID=2781224 RepID=A0ABR3P4G9_9PEZI
MGLLKGGFLRLFQTFLYTLAFCCAAIILGIYSYFLAVLADRDLPIDKHWRAVEGLSGSAVLYTILAVLFTCCLAGVTFFSFLGLVLDVLFIGAMIAVAVMTRDGASSCSGNVKTPLGSGPANSNAVGANNFGFGDNQNLTYSPDLGLACKLNTAAFAVSIIAAFIFLITAIMQIVLARSHKKEKRFGPSPANNYTSGTTNRKFWQRKPKTATEKDMEIGAVGTGAGLSPNRGGYANDLRPSHDTAYTGSTVAAPNAPFAKKETEILSHGGHAPHAAGYNPPHAAHHDYYNANAQDANPYGYDNAVPTTGAAKHF